LHENQVIALMVTGRENLDLENLLYNFTELARSFP